MDTISIQELRKKLQSMRYSKAEMHEADDETLSAMIGHTVLINVLLEWLKKKENQ